MDRDHITRIIAAGALAPSGSNSQPWEFIVEGDAIFVIAHPEKDHPILNVHNRGTWLAIGAVVENMIIAAAAEGIVAQPSYFPVDTPACAAVLRLTSSPVSDTAASMKVLSAAIPARTTNRKPFERKPLAAEFAVRLDTIPSVHWITEESAVAETGNAAAKAERLMLENKALHAQLFKEIVWSRAEEQKRGGGLFIDTMELDPPQEFSFKYAFSKWPVISLLNRIGAAAMVARENGAIYARSARMGVIIVAKSSGAAGYIEAGRTMERTWLTATQHGASFHIIGGILFLRESLLAGNPAHFSNEHAAVIQDAYVTIAKNAKVRDDEDMALLFRIGYGEAPRARSMKTAPRITWR
jgi:hypothetical protein